MYFQLVTEFGEQLSLECERAVWTYHDSGADGDGPSTVRVRHDVAIADRQERDEDRPHVAHHVAVADRQERGSATCGARCRRSRSTGT